MRILSPACTYQETELLLISGAHALLIDFKEGSTHLPTTAVARQASGRRYEVTSINELQKIVERSHCHRAKVYISVDAESYSSRSMEQVVDLIRRLRTSAAIDGIVTGNPGLILAVREEKIPLEIIVSPDEMVLNSQAVMFWNEIGVSKFALPSYLTLGEIESLSTSLPENEFCVTVFRGYAQSENSTAGYGDLSGSDTGLSSMDSIDAVYCSLCSIPRLCRAGISTVAVYLKGTPCHQKIGLITVVKRLVEETQSGSASEESRRIAKEAMECDRLRERGYLCLDEGVKEPCE